MLAKKANERISVANLLNDEYIIKYSDKNLKICNPNFIQSKYITRYME